MSNRIALPIALGLLLAVLALLPRLVDSEYYVHLANMIGLAVMLTTSLNLVFGYTGQISVGHAAFYAIGAYTTAIMMTKLQQSFWIAVPVSVIAAGAAGAALGLPALRLRGYYLAMATLGFAVVVFVVLLQWRPVTGGAMGITGIPRPKLFGFEFATESSYYYLILPATLLTILIVRNIVASPPGRAMIAIRESETAAEALGVDVTKYKMAAFIISSGLAGLAGSLFAPLARYVSPDGFTLVPSIVVLSMLIIGGLGSHLGAILGGILMVLLPEFVDFVGEYRVFVYSICLLLVIIFMPDGLAGLVHSFIRCVNGFLLRRAHGGLIFSDKARQGAEVSAVDDTSVRSSF